MFLLQLNNWLESQVTVAVVWVGGNIDTEPFWRYEAIGIVSCRELYFDKFEPFVASMKQIQLRCEFANGYPVTCLSNQLSVAFLPQLHVFLHAEAKFLFPVVDGRRRCGAYMLLDGEPKDIARPADAQGGRCA